MSEILDRFKLIPAVLSALILCSFIVSFGCARKSENRTSSASSSIQIKGSDTIVNLLQVWAETFSKEKPDVAIGVTGGGSGTGIAALLNGTCDIAMSSRPMEDKELTLAAEKNIKPVQFIVGLDGLAVAVNPGCPVAKLTMDELRDIFMARKTNWKDFGGPDMKIVILSRESNSGTHVFFKEHVLKEEIKKVRKSSASILCLCLHLRP